MVDIFRHSDKNVLLLLFLNKKSILDVGLAVGLATLLPSCLDTDVYYELVWCSWAWGTVQIAIWYGYIVILFAVCSLRLKICTFSIMGYYLNGAGHCYNY